uniref:Uncharacterized protein n=1 Tax=Plectus sambesii TaxID=2011161 RepID=A0A914XJV6_9BILA
MPIKVEGCKARRNRRRTEGHSRRATSDEDDQRPTKATGTATSRNERVISLSLDRLSTSSRDRLSGFCVAKATGGLFAMDTSLSLSLSIVAHPTRGMLLFANKSDRSEERPQAGPAGCPPHAHIGRQIFVVDTVTHLVTLPSLFPVDKLKSNSGGKDESQLGRISPNSESWEGEWNCNRLSRWVFTRINMTASGGFV